MKTLYFLALAVACCASRAFAQGQLTVANSTLVTTNFNGASGAAAPSLTNFKVQLYYQPDAAGSTTPESIGATGLSAYFGNWKPMTGSPIISIFPSAGKFGGGTETTGTDVAPNGAVYLEMIGWSGGFSSLQAAYDSGQFFLLGESTVWSQNTGAGAPGTPASMLGFFPGMTMLDPNPITGGPEPSVLAIAGLGTAMLLLRRRKK